jgi:hypothetical protein
MAKQLDYASPSKSPTALRGRWSSAGGLLAILGVEIAITWTVIVNAGTVLFLVVAALIIGVTVIATIGACLSAAIPRRAPPVVEAESRALLGRCVHCDYDLRGGGSGRCPECGWLVPTPGAVLRWPTADGKVPMAGTRDLAEA